LSDVPQEHVPTFPYRLIDIVVMGKTPSLDIFSSPSKKDYEDAKRILEDLGIANLAEKPYTQLGDGERQLALIARALMQKPKALLLDEPTKYLDVRNKVKVLTMVRRLAYEKKLTIFMTLHDPNDAIIFSDRIVLIDNGEIKKSLPSEKITEDDLRKVYGIPFKVIKMEISKQSCPP